MITPSGDEATKRVKNQAEHLKTLIVACCPLGHVRDASLNHIDDAVLCATQALESMKVEERKKECISDLAFKSLPQVVHDWIKELGWKREDIVSVHIEYSSPKVVTLTNMQQESRIAQFGLLTSGMEKKEKVK